MVIQEITHTSYYVAGRNIWFDIFTMMPSDL